MGRPHSTGQRPELVVPSPDTGSSDVRAGGFPHSPAELHASPSSRLSPKTWLITGVALVVVIGSGIIYRISTNPSEILVKVNPIPEDSSVVLDGASCSVPCQRLLSPGNRTVKAEHDGYTSLTQKIRVERGGSPNFSVPLSAIESAKANPATVANENVAPVGASARRKEHQTGLTVALVEDRLQLRVAPPHVLLPRQKVRQLKRKRRPNHHPCSRTLYLLHQLRLRSWSGTFRLQPG